MLYLRDLIISDPMVISATETRAIYFYLTIYSYTRISRKCDLKPNVVLSRLPAL